MRSQSDRVCILNVCIDNIAQDELLKNLSNGIVFTPNVDHLIRLQDDREFYSVYKNADFVLCDSKILQYVAAFLERPIKEKISGSDFFPAFYRFHKDNKDIRIFLLGASEGVAQRAMEKINSAVGRNIVVDCRSPSFGFEKDIDECMDIVRQINHSKATVLAVGVGTPKQESWIVKFMHTMPSIRIFLAIGATIDFEAGCKKRASHWISETGFEWLHRLILEPKRLWKRYLIADIPFFWLVLKQKMGLYIDPFA